MTHDATTALETDARTGRVLGTDVIPGADPFMNLRREVLPHIPKFTLAQEQKPVTSDTSISGITTQARLERADQRLRILQGHDLELSYKSLLRKVQGDRQVTRELHKIIHGTPGLPPAQKDILIRQLLLKAGYSI